jgi:hypothetical protein
MNHPSRPKAESRLYKIAHCNPRPLPDAIIEVAARRPMPLDGSAHIPRFDLGLVVQDDVQQGIVDLDFSVVFDKTQFAEFIHEKAHARSGRADHLRQRFLTKRSHDRLWPAFLAKICKEKEKPGKTFFARIK